MHCANAMLLFRKSWLGPKMPYPKSAKARHAISRLLRAAGGSCFLLPVRLFKYTVLSTSRKLLICDSRSSTLEKPLRKFGTLQI